MQPTIEREGRKCWGNNKDMPKNKEKKKQDGD
jgi:hypothetical protein